MRLAVLYEDNHVLAVAKPAGMLVQGDATGDVALVEHARRYRQQREAKPGRAYIGLVHRLDRPVSGVVVFAKTSKAAARLSEQFRSATIAKVYLAVVEGRPRPSPVTDAGLWENSLLKPPGRNVVVVTKGEDRVPEAKPARTSWRRLATAPGLALLELTPHTGRSHQLRVQASHHGMPIVGDVKYGAERPFAGGIALHAWRLTFEHPTRREPMTVTCPPPPPWRAFPFASVFTEPA